MSEAISYSTSDLDYANVLTSEFGWRFWGRTYSSRVNGTVSLDRFNPQSARAGCRWSYSVSGG